MNQKGFGLLEFIIFVGILGMLYLIFSPHTGSRPYRQIVCTSVVDHSVVKSEPSKAWVHSTESESWDDYDKMGSFSPRKGDSCHLEVMQ